MLETLPRPRAVTVFCGSRLGADPRHAAAARALGAALAQAQITLVYGGGRLGLMGVLADAALAAGGQVRGIIPDFLRAREVAHPGVRDMIGVPSMHARKAMMLEMSDAAIMLPGGLGTLDETIELITWRALGLHAKPIIICDIAGSARGLLGAVAAAVEDGFTDASAHGLYRAVGSIAELMDALGADAGLSAAGQG